MESNWRWNVHAMGLSDSGVELVSPLLGDPDTAIAKQILGVERKVTYIRSANPDFSWVPHTFALPPADHPHFPYGEDVDPD